MICDICGQNEAVVVINKIMNNTKHELHLCMKCAKERGLITKNGRLEMSLEGLFENISASKNNDRLCPVCGCKLSEIKKTFKVGCPECYSIFSDEIKNEKAKKEPYKTVVEKNMTGGSIFNLQKIKNVVYKL